MAAPSISGAVDVSGAPAAMSSPTWTGITAAPLLTTANSQFRVGWTSGVTIGTVYGGRIAFSGGARDFTNKMIMLAATPPGTTGRITSFGSNLTTVSGGMIALMSSSGNGRRWKVFGGDDNTLKRICIDPSQTSTMQSEIGTFNIASVEAIEFHLQANSSSAAEIRVAGNDSSTRRVYEIPGTGVVVAGGDVPNGAAGLAIVAQTPPYSNLLNAASSDAFSSAIPIRFQADLLDITRGYLNLEKVVTDGADNYGLIHVPTSKHRVFFDIGAGDSGVIDSSYFLATNKGSFDVSVNATGFLEIFSSSLQNFTDLEFLGGDLVSSIINEYDSIVIDGASATSTTFSGGTVSTDAITIANIPGGALVGIIASTQGKVVITETAGNYASTLRLELPDDHRVEMDGGGGAYDFSGLTGGSVGNPVIFDAVDGGVYTITLGSGIVADVADPVASGSVTIVAPTPTLTISGIPAGGIFTIWDNEDSDDQDLGTALQTTNPTTGNNIYYVGTAGNAVIFQFVPNTGASANYQEFNIPGTIPATSQTIDFSSNLKTEVNI